MAKKNDVRMTRGTCPNCGTGYEWKESKSQKLSETVCPKDETHLVRTKGHAHAKFEDLYEAQEVAARQEETLNEAQEQLGEPVQTPEASDELSRHARRILRFLGDNEHSAVALSIDPKHGATSAFFIPTRKGAHVRGWANVRRRCVQQLIAAGKLTQDKTLSTERKHVFVLAQ